MNIDQIDRSLERPEPRMGAIYLRVIVVEIIVLIGLWILGRAFNT